MTVNDYDREPVPGDVLVQLSFPAMLDGSTHVNLRVTDQMSGLPLVDFQMDAEQFASMMSRTATRVSGATLPPRPEWIGKRVVHDSTRIGRLDTRDPEQVRADYLAAGWDVAQVRRTNFGHEVVARRWIDHTTQES